MTCKEEVKACIPCRDRKRKCDRATPSCSLCYRLGRVCQYGSPKTVSSPSTSSRSERSIVKTQHLRILPPKFSMLSFFEDVEASKHILNNAITEQLSKAVGNVADVRDVAATYFGTIHLWFPIISETMYYEQLSSTFVNPHADYSLLSMSMALINTIPPAKGKPDTLSPLYAVLKTSIAIIESANINSLAVVQARLLVSLFEVGHGIPAAYISLAATARAAASIGINKTNHSTYSLKMENDLCVWWGIVMLDRYFTLERGEGPCATQDLGSPDHLPRDGSVWDQKILSSNERLTLATPSSIRVGPFARQAQVSHVLDLLLLHLRDQKLKQKLYIEESDQLARTLLAFSRLLPEDTPQPWPRYCGAIGTCYGALMVLHESRSQLPPTTRPASYATSFLQSSLKDMTWISQRFNEKIDQMDIHALSPFPPHALFMAACRQDRLWKETGELRYLDAASSLRVMLGHFERRWMNAGKFLRLLEVEQKSYEQVGRVVSDLG